MYSKNDAKVVLFVLIYKQKTGLFDVCLKYIAYLCAFLKNLEMTKAELCKSIYPQRPDVMPKPYWQ